MIETSALEGAQKERLQLGPRTSVYTQDISRQWIPSTTWYIRCEESLHSKHSCCIGGRRLQSRSGTIAYLVQRYLTVVTRTLLGPEPY